VISAALAVRCYRSGHVTGTETVRRSLGSRGRMWQSEAAMTITYANGMQVEGVVLARTEDTMRV